MDNSCDAPASTSAWGGWPAFWRSLRAELQQVWGHAPSYSTHLSWAAVRRAALRCVCSSALLFAVFAPQNDGGHVDLYPTYVAANLANEGHWDHIYHPSNWIAPANDPLWATRAVQLIAPQRLNITSFVYHPWYLQAMRPVVSRLNYTEFQELWFTVNRLCIVAVAFGITLLAGLSRWRDQALLTVLIAAASVTTYSMFTGQNILVALTFALAATLAWQSSAPLWLGGVFAACAWACKTWCVSLVVLCFLLRGPRAGAMTSVVLGFVMVVLPELVMPGALMDDYHMLTLALSVISVPAFNNISILSNFERLSDSSWSTHLHEWIPHAAHPALRTLALSLTTVLFLPGVLIWRRRRASVRYACAAYLAFMLLPLGVCWTHYFVFALPLACMCCFGDHRSRTLRALGLALLMLLCGIMDYLEDGDSPLWNFVFQPSAYPVKQSAVVVFVVITCFAALGLAPRETHQQLPTSRAG